jgi:hypothetical protein
MLLPKLMSLDVKPSKQLEKIFNDLLQKWYNGSHLNGRYNTNLSQYPKTSLENKENVLQPQSSLKVPFLPNEANLEEKIRKEVKSKYETEYNDENSSDIKFSRSQYQKRSHKANKNIQAYYENLMHFLKAILNKDFNPANYTLIATDYFGENAVNEYKRKWTKIEENLIKTPYSREILFATEGEMDYYEQNKSNAHYNNLSNGNEDENFLY